MAMKQPDMSSLTPEEIAQLRKAQKRRFFLALILGTIMAILGFFAGQRLAGGDTNGTGAVINDTAVTTVLGERMPTVADFERTEKL